MSRAVYLDFSKIFRDDFTYFRAVILIRRRVDVNESVSRQRPEGRRKLLKKFRAALRPI